MADTVTTAYALTKPEVGASEDTWGTKINTDLDTLDTVVNAIGGKTAAATLSYADAAKVATTATGVDITGTVTADGLTVDIADQVLINHSGDGGGIRIDSTNATNTSSIRFGDVADNYIGALEYNHSNDSMAMYVNNATRLTIDSSGNVDISGTVTADGLEIDKGGIGETASFSGDANSGARALQIIASTTTNTGDTHSINSQSSTGILKLSTANNTTRMAVFPTGDISFYEDTGTTPKFFWDASAEFLGLGTTTADTNLHVYSATRNNVAVFESGDADVSLYLRDGNSTSISAVGIGASTDDLTFRSGNTERMRIDASGNVGIGTSSPNSYAGYTTLTLDGTSGSLLDFEVNGTITGELYADATTAIGMQAIGSRYIQFKTNNTERMRIDSSGNVGIGTSSPTTALDARGGVNSAHATFTGQASRGLVISTVNTLSNDDGVVYNAQTTGSGKHIFQTAGTERLRIDSSGIDVTGIAVADGLTVDHNTALYQVDKTLSSYSSQNGVYLNGNGYGWLSMAGDGTQRTNIRVYGQNSSSGEQITFQTANVERMRIDSSGNVLVGKTSAGIGIAGFQANPTGDTYNTVSGNITAYYNRLSSDGDIVQFRKDGTTVGSIGTSGGSSYIAGLAATGGIGFASSGGQPFINPVTNTGANNDNAINLGHSTSRFEDLYLSGGVITGGGGTSSTGEIQFVADSTRARIVGGYNSGGGGYLAFRTDTSGGTDLERLRIDSSGNLLVGATASESGLAKAFIEYSSQSQYGLELHDNSIGTTATQIAFYKQTAIKGSITTTASATSYNTSSDYRLKTDAQPMTGASARVQALNPVNFEWITDGTRVDGFLAHEAQEVVPEAVTGTKDAMRDEEYEVTPAVLDDDGNETTAAVMGTRSVPDMQGIDQSKLVPLLTAALQEALTKIDTMEARITALEGA